MPNKANKARRTKRSDQSARTNVRRMGRMGSPHHTLQFCRQTGCSRIAPSAQTPYIVTEDHPNKHRWHRPAWPLTKQQTPKNKQQTTPFGPAERPSHILGPDPHFTTYFYLLNLSQLSLYLFLSIPLTLPRSVLQIAIPTLIVLNPFNHGANSSDSCRSTAREPGRRQ